MIARLRAYSHRLIDFWFHWASFKLGVFVGWIGGMLSMSIVMTAVFTAPDVARLLAERVLP